MSDDYNFGVQNAEMAEPAKEPVLPEEEGIITPDTEHQQQHEPPVADTPVADTPIDADLRVNR